MYDRQFSIPHSRLYVILILLHHVLQDTWAKLSGMSFTLEAKEPSQW